MKQHQKQLLLSLLIVIDYNSLFPIQSFQIQPFFSIVRKRITRNIIIAQQHANDEEVSLMRSVGDSELSNAFEALPEREKYDTVLVGLCTKIIDASSKKKEKTEDEVANETEDEVLTGPVQLLEEMSMRNIRASTRSISVLIDAATQSKNAWVVADTMSSCIRNKSFITNRFGSLQGQKYPVIADSSPRIPPDDRIVEVASASAFLLWMVVTLIASKGVGSGPLLNDSFDYGDFAWNIFASTAFSLSLVVILVDNFYEISRSTLTFVKKDLELPKELPFSLGKGQLTGVVTRGLTRLFSSNTERDCECEAAAFFTAYSLGLPCFAFRPNALEAAILLFQSGQAPSFKTNYQLSPLLSQSGVIKILTWLMSPVAIESIKHPQLLSSDPREGIGFIKRIKEKCSSFDVPLSDVEDMLGDTSEEDLVQYAYVQAFQLIRENKEIISDLKDRLLTGTATVGDCVAVLEQ